MATLETLRQERAARATTVTAVHAPLCAVPGCQGECARPHAQFLADLRRALDTYYAQQAAREAAGKGEVTP